LGSPEGFAEAPLGLDKLAAGELARAAADGLAGALGLAACELEGLGAGVEDDGDAACPQAASTQATTVNRIDAQRE
jgi:hypothetical protein